MLLVAATSTGTSSETATATYQLSVGTAVSQYGYGWGTYQWGKEAWGTARSTSNVTIDGRNWSFDNFGEDLLATVNNVSHLLNPNIQITNEDFILASSIFKNHGQYVTFRDLIN